MSKVWEWMCRICGGRGGVSLGSWMCFGQGERGWGEGRGEGGGGQTLEARAEGSLLVPKSSVAFFRSASLTFW